MDIARLLNEWPYEPGQINVRVIEGEDGNPKIQMRLDLGLLQMEMTGRPDGQRPSGYESYLEYCEALLDEAGPVPSENFDGDEGDADDEETVVDSPEAPGGVAPAEPPGPAGEEPGAGTTDAPDAGRELSGDDCRMLREEAVQYYHRYISLLVLGDYQGVIRDTSRNLRALDLCRNHAADEDDREALEQFRPYILMMRHRAVALQAIADNEPKAALWAIDEGLEAVRGAFAAQSRLDEFNESTEVQLLRGMRDELTRKLPASQASELRERLQKAIQQENYELAAILRDELKTLKD
ncbi:MAG: UvrB/UvrC motif-containing protein [Phycisphaerales bacterium]|nr:UvrB/UvrC motif-containing protein [Phycisphaerales bacterium]